MKNRILKTSFILLSILLIIPSVIYLAQNKTILGFDTYYNFFVNENVNKIFSTVIYLILFLTIMIVYLAMLRQKQLFKDIKQTLKYVTIIGLIFLVMLPWTSSDIFYYMGVGELDSKYGQNPYYVTMEEYYGQNKENINDEILEQGANNFWASTTVVYGPIAQIIFKLCTSISFKNIDMCIVVFKLLNLILHLLNCYLIYKISGKNKFVVIYGLNPYIFLEFIANAHNDIIVIFFILLTLYFLIKRKNVIASILFLALATGIKYFTVMLLPIVILYHFREEEKVLKRLLKCIQYGVLFVLIFALEYIPYFEDINVLLAAMPQTERYSGSIYSALYGIKLNPNLIRQIKLIFTTAYIYLYLCFCLEFLLKKKNNIFDMLRKYNIIVILSLLSLTNWHPWYLIWLFGTIMWQKTKTIQNIIGLTTVTEIANSIYMFKEEWYIYDNYFVGTIIVLFVMWQLINRKCKNEVENEQIKRNTK